MNFGLMISCNVETKLAAVERSDDWTQADEALEYERCLREVVEEHGRAWADGNIRMGDYILIVSLARVGLLFSLFSFFKKENTNNIDVARGLS